MKQSLVCFFQLEVPGHLGPLFASLGVCLGAPHGRKVVACIDRRQQFARRIDYRIRGVEDPLSGGSLASFFGGTSGRYHPRDYQPPPHARRTVNRIDRCCPNPGVHAVRVCADSTQVRRFESDTTCIARCAPMGSTCWSRHASVCVYLPVRESCCPEAVLIH